MNSGSFRFIEAVRDSYLCQHITEPTRIRVNETPTTLDLILTERENDIYGIDYDSPLGKSDHVLTLSSPINISSHPNQEEYTSIIKDAMRT